MPFWGWLWCTKGIMYIRWGSRPQGEGAFLGVARPIEKHWETLLRSIHKRLNRSRCRLGWLTHLGPRNNVRMWSRSGEQRVTRWWSDRTFRQNSLTTTCYCGTIAGNFWDRAWLTARPECTRSNMQCSVCKTNTLSPLFVYGSHQRLAWSSPEVASDVSTSRDSAAILLDDTFASCPLNIVATFLYTVFFSITWITWLHSWIQYKLSIFRYHTCNLW